MVSQREEKLTSIFLALIFAYAEIFLINSFTGLYTLIIPTYYFKKISFMFMFLWTLMENIPYYLLNLLLAFYLSLYFLKIDTMLNDLPIFAFILFNIIFKGLILLETYAYSDLPALEIAGLSGEVVSIIISSIFAYFGWKISWTLLKKGETEKVMVLLKDKSDDAK